MYINAQVFNAPLLLHFDSTFSIVNLIYRVIHKSLQDFRPLRYRSRDGHAEGEHVNRGRDSTFLSHLTGARYVHPWWRGRCQTRNQVPATHGKSVVIRGTSRAAYATWFTTAATKDRGGSRRYRPPDVGMCGRNFIRGLTSAASPRVDISSTCKVGQKNWSVSPSVYMLPFGVTIPASVPQRSEIPEGIMNYPVRYCTYN
jgi:hypothetical protein